MRCQFYAKDDDRCAQCLSAEKEYADLQQFYSDAGMFLKENIWLREKLIMQEAKLMRLVDAARLTVLHFSRMALYPEINFMGDDEHEAWGALEAALKSVDNETDFAIKTDKPKEIGHE
jgi:hypothetical protein